MNGTSVLDVVKRHGDAMSSMDPEFIVQDYAEDAVIITNLWDKPAKGHEEIKEVIRHCIQYEVLMSDQYEDHTILDQSEGDYALHVFEKGDAKVFGVETYIVKNNKIVFETAHIQFDPNEK